MNLEELGLTKEEAQERVINHICDRLLLVVGFDDEGEEYGFNRPSTLAQKLDAKIKQRIDEGVAALAEKHILPNAVAYLEKLTLQSTNKWGEVKGQKLTFIEYLTERAEAYLTEVVSFQGKTKEEDGYNFKGAQTRLTYIVNQHLQYSIETAMKKAVVEANKGLGDALAETAKIQLESIAKKLKVNVTT